MNRYDRTWPIALMAIAVGALVGRAFLAPIEARWLAPPTEEVAQPAPVVVSEAPAARTVVQPPRLVLEEAGGTLTLVDAMRMKATLEEQLDILRTSDDPMARRAAAAKLAVPEEGEKVIGALMIAVATDPSPGVRGEAARSLGLLRMRAAMGSLEVVAKGDVDPRVRIVATAALAEAGRAESIPVLGQILSSEGSEAVRAEAVRSLLTFGDAESMGLVGPLLVQQRSALIDQAIVEGMRRSRR